MSISNMFANRADIDKSPKLIQVTFVGLKNDFIKYCFIQMCRAGLSPGATVDRARLVTFLRLLAIHRWSLRSLIILHQRQGVPLLQYRRDKLP